MNIQYNQSCRGGSSILAVFFVTLFSVLALSFTGMTNTNLQMAKNHSDLSEAQAMAESGLAYANMLFADFISVGFETPFSGSALTVEEAQDIYDDFVVYLQTADNLDTSLLTGGIAISNASNMTDTGGAGVLLALPTIKVKPDDMGGYVVTLKQYDDTPEELIIISQGQIGDITRAVQLNYNITKDPAPIFDFAIFAKDQITLNNSNTVDAYNYVGDDTEPLQIGVNSTASNAIYLNNSVTVDGDVLVGPGGDPDDVIEMINSVTITGDSSSIEEEWVPPSVTVPESLLSGPLLPDITINNTTVTLTDSGKYGTINLGNSSKLIIDGDVTLYVTGAMIVGNSASLDIVNTEGSSLTLFVGGDFSVTNSGTLNNLTTEPYRLIGFGDEHTKKPTRTTGSVAFSATPAHPEPAGREWRGRGGG